MTASLIDVLHTDRPAPDRADKMGLYGWLIGSWEMDTVVHADDGTTQKGRGEIHFGWVLEGRAIQDVWILPGVFFGTTLRVYDPGLDAWHILWSDPLRQFYTRQIGRAHGADIVQEGTNDAGDTTRWSFSEITGDSFRWRGERSRDGGATWQLLDGVLEDELGRYPRGAWLRNPPGSAHEPFSPDGCLLYVKTGHLG
jgi:ChrR Cupin-like domain